jgi:NlpC/P60 family putative phage cell wall peptidase
MTTGYDVAKKAREWIGTPYHHQASLKGVGCDCLGLCRGIYREIVGPEPIAMPNYSPGWDEVAKTEIMLRTFNTYLKKEPISYRGAGFILLFRMRRNAVAKHCGIMTNNTHFIHSHAGRKTVEIELTEWWVSKLIGVFSFPGVQ